jgi:perosamine synthetase
MNQLISHSRPTLDNNDLTQITELFDSKMLSSGSTNKKFSEKLSKYLRNDKVSIFSSASSGLFHVLKVLELGNKIDVLLPNYICESVIKAVLLAGFNPVLYDNSPNSWISDIDIIKKSLTTNTGAIIVNHTFGIFLDGIENLAKSGIPIIEDCCHAFSSSISDEEISKHSICSFYSFDSTKWIATGNGGAVASRNRDFMNRLESIKVDQGISDLNCSLGISQLEKIEEFKSKRAEIAHQYFKEMPFLTKGSKNLKSCFFRFPILVSNSSLFFDSKKVAYRKGVDQLLKSKYNSNTNLINSERIFEKTVSIPIYPSLTKNQIEIIINETKKIFYEN